jgi:hypothetical protein
MRVFDAEMLGTAVVADRRQAGEHGRGASSHLCRSPGKPKENQFIRLEIRSETLSSLIQNRAIMIEDLCGLDRKAKHYLQKVLLESLLR